MKIAFVYDAVYPWVKGGAEKRIYELGKRLAVQGNEVHVFGVKWWEGTDVIKYDGLVLHGVCGPMEMYVNGRRSIAEAIIFSVRLLPDLFKERFDVIDVCAFPYFSCFSVKLASIIRRTPMVITWHEVWGDYWYEYMGKPGFFGKIIEALVSKLTDRAIAVSEMTEMGLESLGVPEKSISIVSNGVDLEKIRKIAPSNHRCDMIFAGRLIREKNVDILIQSIAHLIKTLPDVRCHIIGDGPEKERLVRMADRLELQDNVRFLGFMDDDEVIARTKSAKVLALPSSREGFGLVILEAFACGVPVVTVRCPGNAGRMLVDDNTGILVEPDAKDLSEAFRKLIIDEVLREKMSASALKKAGEYDWERMAGQLARIYEEKLHDHQDRSSYIHCWRR